MFNEPTKWVFLLVFAMAGLIGVWQLTHPIRSGDARRRPLDWIFVTGCILWAASWALSLAGKTRLEELTRFIGALLSVVNGITYLWKPLRDKLPAA